MAHIEARRQGASRVSWKNENGPRDNSEKYAKAVGSRTSQDPKGMCVKCHATYVAKALTLEGVGCEGCHGPASGYREFHSKSPKDTPALSSGAMRDIQMKPVAWVKTCRDCHVLDGKSEYDALIEAGHKDNRRWNVSDKFAGVSTHWQKVKYVVAEIDAAFEGHTGHADWIASADGAFARGPNRKPPEPTPPGTPPLDRRPRDRNPRDQENPRQ